MADGDKFSWVTLIGLSLLIFRDSTISPGLNVVSGEYNIFWIVSKLFSFDGGTGAGTTVAIIFF